jgi:hypothetical protein
MEGDAVNPSPVKNLPGVSEREQYALIITWRQFFTLASDSLDTLD